MSTVGRRQRGTVTTGPRRWSGSGSPTRQPGRPTSTWTAAASADRYAHFGVDGVVATEAICVDRRLQWSRAGNVWRNAAIRSVLYTLTGPVRRRRR
jgi:hypothetical protein